MTLLAIIDLDLSTPAGVALAQAVEARHGARLVAAARLASRFILLRSAWAPGLRFVGANAEGGLTALSGAKPERLSLAGAGEALDDAFVSCVGEGVERLAQYERPGDVVRLSMADAAPHLMPDAVLDVMHRLGADGHAETELVDWVRASALGTREEWLVPADGCLRRQQPGPLRDPQAALSTGAAAGPHVAAATERAILELIERDAASLWWEGGRRGRPIAMDGEGAREAVRVLGALRAEATERATWLLDITTDVAVPVIAAISVGTDGRGFCCGLAARLNPAEAARAATVELCQMEIGLLIAMTKRAGGNGTEPGEIDRRHLARAERIDAATCALLHPLGVPRWPEASSAPSTPEMRLQLLGERLACVGVSVALVDLTRPDIGIAVVKALAPRLQPLPSGTATERLQHAVADTGGGRSWTGGIALG